MPHGYRGMTIQNTLDMWIINVYFYPPLYQISFFKTVIMLIFLSCVSSEFFIHTRGICWITAFHGLQGDPTIHSEGDQPWGFFGRNDASTLATLGEELTHWKRLWCWEGLGAGGEGDDRGWDGWMASLTRWTRVWVNSGSWWWTGRPGALRFMGSQRVGHDWETELKWTDEEQKQQTANVGRKITCIPGLFIWEAKFIGSLSRACNIRNISTVSSLNLTCKENKSDR